MYGVHQGQEGKLPYLQYFDYLEQLGNGGLYYNMSINNEVPGTAYSRAFNVHSAWRVREVCRDSCQNREVRQLELTLWCGSWSYLL